jgi:hypothetical protein
MPLPSVVLAGAPDATRIVNRRPHLFRQFRIQQ